MRRELPFLARLGETNSPVLVRGVMEGVIVKEDSLTIFEFKTDRVDPAALAERTAHYRPQLLAYAWALGEIWGCPAAVAYVVFLLCYGPARGDASRPRSAPGLTAYTASLNEGISGRNFGQA